METRIGPVRSRYNSRGDPTYCVEHWHDGLRKHRVIQADSPYLVEQKVRLQAEEWRLRWQGMEEMAKRRDAKDNEKRRQEERKEQAADMSKDAEQALSSLETLLVKTLSVDDKIDWSKLKDDTEFPERAPNAPAVSAPPVAPRAPHKPNVLDPRYTPKLGLLDKLIPSRRKLIEESARARFSSDTEAWNETVRQLNDSYAAALKAYEIELAKNDANHTKLMADWAERRDEFLRRKAEGHATVEAKKAAYLNKDAAAIIDYCELVLSMSAYPDFFPQEFDLEYEPELRTLIVDYQLPAPEDLPMLKAVRFVASRDSLEETHISEPHKARLYDSVLYQVALRTIHELFEADVVDGLAAVVFNGLVTAIDRTTGKESTSCVLSVRTAKSEFLEINLAQVDPKACFRALKGVSGAKLSGLTPVAPLMQMRREDRRFVAAYGVADTLDEGVNLAAMAWEDFEHLIRELFEKEFSSSGGEVKVTQASRDGGVDAIAFDPDPIRGGKIVIQAKRWTNTVGVAAVRDLYGTVMAEGATKGVLVTTSDFGTDSYSFAAGKPLVLLSGANLLHMLDRHGHKARIDIREARATRVHQHDSGEVA